MGKFFSTLFLGLLAAIIGATIQQRTWRHRSFAELQEKDYVEARKTVEEIAAALDKRLSGQRLYTRRVLRKTINDDEIEAYRNITADWMGMFSTNKSKLFHSFGYSTVLAFEQEIQSSLQYTSAIVGLGRRLGTEQLSTKDKNDFFGSEIRLNIIQHRIYKFLNELNSRIADGDIGRSKAINNLNENDLNMISKVYLIRRLFGMSGKAFLT